MIGKFVRTKEQLYYHINGGKITIGENAKGLVSDVQRPGFFYVSFPITPDISVSLIVSEKVLIKDPNP